MGKVAPCFSRFPGGALTACCSVDLGRAGRPLTVSTQNDLGLGKKNTRNAFGKVGDGRSAGFRARPRLYTPLGAPSHQEPVTPAPDLRDREGRGREETAFPAPGRPGPRPCPAPGSRSRPPPTTQPQLSVFWSFSFISSRHLPGLYPHPTSYFVKSFPFTKHHVL